VRAVSDDVELEYEVLGEGPELVWLHGLSGSLAEAHPLVEVLSTRFRVLSYSTRGHGRSTAVHERHRYHYDVIADDLQRMLEHVGFERPIIAGGSHGANTALRHALRHPGNTRALLLVAPGANALARPKRPHWWLLRGHLQLQVWRGEPFVVRAITGHDPRDPGLDEAARAKVAAARTHDLASLLSAMRLIPDQQVVDPALLPGLDLPATVAAWDKDPIIHPIAVARQVAALLPQAEFVEIGKPADVGDAAAHALLLDLATRLHARA
jgi:pimeloyl-ACP methyl ester carboxylesterase